MVDLIFNSFILLVIGAVFYYVGKRYLAGMLQKQQALETVSFAALRRQRDELEKQKQNLQVSVRHQHIEYQHLVEKIARWREVVIARDDAAQATRVQIEHAVTQRRMQQAHDMRVAALHAQVIPQAVAEAERALRTQFHSEADHSETDHSETVVRAYMRKLIAELERGDA